MAVFTFDLTESQLKIAQAQQLMRLVDMGILDHASVREQILQSVGENPWRIEMQLEIAPVPLEKIESPPGKRKIIL